MEVIIQAKERQAAEANKNASILLHQLDLEKVVCKLIILMLDFVFSNMKRIKKQLLQEKEQEKRSRRKRNKHRSEFHAIYSLNA